MPAPTTWRPISLADLPAQFGDFTAWILCGGHSIDLLLGHTTRPHGDIDIGVFRSELDVCLRAIGLGRVFLCLPGTGHALWDGTLIDPSIHDIWITDSARQFWQFQVMVFDDEGDEVTYRRDRRLRWPKSAHSVTVGSTRVLNPLITFLFKTHQSRMQDKDALDVQNLIRAAAVKF